MAFQLYEFLNHFMIDTFLIKLTQFEKTGTVDEVYLLQKKLIIKNHFRNYSTKIEMKAAIFIF